MIYECNQCGDEFSIKEQNMWSIHCFHCSKGILSFKKYTEEEKKMFNEHTRTTGKLNKGGK